jgi:hypothetical protein
LKPIVDGLAGEQWARRRKTGESIQILRDSGRPFLRKGREDPKRPRWRGRKKPSRRQAHVVEQKRIEKKLKVPQEQRTPQKKGGRAERSPEEAATGNA